MKIVKTKNVKTPMRSTDGSAGIDFFVPESITEHWIKPNEDVNIPSGIKVKLNPGTALLAVNKSGIATKSKLIVGACLIDEDYTGEVHLHVINYSNKPQRIFAGQKLVQFLLINYIKDEITLIEDDVDDVFEPTTRGDKGFGSTQTEPEAKVLLSKTTAILAKRDGVKKSRLGGTYQRHYFVDYSNKSITYILDVSHKTNPAFLNLRSGDILTNLTVFNDGVKNYINGRSDAKIVQIEKNKNKGIEL